MRILKILLKTGAAFTSLIFILYLAFMIYLRTAAGQKIITSYLSSVLTEALSAEIKIEAINTNLFTRADIERLCLKINGDTALYFSRAKISYSLLSIVGGKLKFENIFIDSLTACVKRDSAGIFQLDLLNPKNENTDNSGASLSVSINKLTLHRSKLCYDDASFPLTFNGESVHADISLKNKVLHTALETKSVHLSYLKPFDIDSLNISASISSSAVLIDTLQLHLDELDVKGKINIGYADSLTFNGRIHGEGRPYVIAAAFIDEKIIDNYYKNENTVFDLCVRGALTDLDIASSFSKLTILSIPVSETNISMNLKNELLTVKEISLSLLKGSISGSGYFRNNKQKNYALNLKVNNLEAASLIPAKYNEIPLKRSQINGDVLSNGSFINIKNISLTSSLQFSNIKEPANSFSTDINVSNGNGDLCIRHGKDNCLGMIIKIDEKPGRGTFRGKIDSVEFLSRQFNAPLVHGSIIYSGSFDWPHIQAKISAKSIKYERMPLDTAYAELSYSDSTLTFDRIYFSSNDTLTNPFGIDRLSTIINYDGNLNGAINNLNGNIRASLVNLDIKNYQIDTVYSNLKLNNSLVEIDSFFIRKKSGFLSLKGKINQKSKRIDMHISVKNSPRGISAVLLYPDSLYRLNLTGEDIPVNDIMPFIPDMPAWKGLIDLNLSASSDAHLKNPHGLLNFFTVKPSYRNTTYADSIRIKAQFSQERLQIDTLQFYLLGEHAAARISIDFSDSVTNPYHIAHSEGRLSGNNIDLKVFNPFMPAGYLIKGNSTHNFAWNGTYSNPNFDGFLKINDGKITKDEDETIADAINISISVSDTLIKIDSIAFKNNSVPVFTRGLLDIQSDKITVSLDSYIKDKRILQIDGFTTLDSISIKSDLRDFNLSFLDPLIPSLYDLQGSVNSLITVEGDIKDPDINGNLNIGQLGFSQEYIDTPVRNGVVAIKFKKNSVSIDTLNLPVKAGYVSLSGEIGFDTLSFSYFDIGADINNIDIREPEVFQLLLSKGHLKLTTQKGIHTLQGDLFLGDSKFFRDLKIDDLWKMLISKSQSTYTDKEETELDILSLYEEDLKNEGFAIPDFLKNMEIDIDLNNKGDLWVYNNVADFYLTVVLNLSGEIINPALTGRITVEENGRMNFLDRVFEIKKGVFEFAEADKINPIINLSAESEIDVPSGDGDNENTYLINLLIDGPLDQLNMSLTSQPSMEPSDIITLLTLGMTYDDLASLSGSTESSDALKKRGGEIAGQVISQKMNSYLKKVLGNEGGNIDFELQGDIFDMDDARLAVNKRWGKRVTISYSTSIKDFDKRVIHIEYKISDSFSLEGETNQDQESAIDFKYRIRFK